MYQSPDRARADDAGRVADARGQVAGTQAEMDRKNAARLSKMRFEPRTHTRAEFVARMREALGHNGWGEILKPSRPRPVTLANFEYEVFVATFGTPTSGHEPPDRVVDGRPMYATRPQQRWSYRCSDGVLTLRVELGWPRLIVSDIAE